jgi:hypothetical protein
MPVRERIFRLRQGINWYDPEISFVGPDFLDLEVRDLENIHPRHGFLESAKGLVTLQTLNNTPKEDLNGFPSYTDPATTTTNIYAVTTGSIFQFLTATQVFDTTPLLTLDNLTDMPIAWAPWDTKVYITKLGQPLISIDGVTATK